MAGKYTTKVLTGQVSGIFFNEVDEDENGNTIKPVVSLDKKYRITFNNRKDKTFKIQYNSGWQVLNTGDHISVEVKVYPNPKGGANYYGKVKDIKLQSPKTTGSSDSGGYSKSKSYSGGGKANPDEYQAGISSGHAMTNAISYYTAVSKGKELDLEKVEALAVQIAEATSRVKQVLLNGGSKPVKDSVDEFNEEDELEGNEELVSADSMDDDDEGPF